VLRIGGAGGDRRMPLRAKDAGMPREAQIRPSISVILPTYNERENIGPLIEQVFQSLGEEAEVIVVDDDSPDGTSDLVEKLAASRERLRLFRRTSERGLVSALNAGIGRAEADVVAWLDCDFSMPPRLLRTFLDEIRRGYDMVFGSRFVDGGGVEIVTGSRDSVSAFLLSRLLNHFIQKVLGPEIKDYTSGFVAVRKPVVEEIGLNGDYGEYFIELSHRARRRGYRILEIPYISLARREGTSKTGTNIFHYLKRGIKYIRKALSLRFSRSE
jgi:dolichol-phosphate mannosyltransferase